MNVEYVNSSNFDKYFSKVLETKKGKNIITGRYDIEAISVESKSNFIIKFISSLNSIFGLTYKILYWEKDITIKNFVELNFHEIEYKIATPYRNGKSPGIVYIEDKLIDKDFLKNLLDIHLKYEIETTCSSLNLRVQICINQKDFNILLDIYDDRGFDIYYMG